MATTAPEPTAAAPRLPLKPASAPGAARKRRPRGMRWLLGLLLLVVIAGSVWAATSGLGGLVSHEPTLHVLTQKVEREDLLITVTAAGNVESAKNVDVRCQVAGGSSILWIIPDGSVVKQGDELVRLNSATIEDQVNQQKILYEKAQATRIDAEKMYSAAKLAVQEYIEGTYIKELQTVEGTITIALEGLRSAENSLQHIARMARKGYVTPLQLDAQKFAVERAKLDLAAAQTSKTVLEKFTKAKMFEDLQSARDSAEARMRSEQAASELELTRLKRLMTQLEQCTISAPQDGMVVYANDMTSSRSSSQIKIEEGAMVRERQAIVRLPDLSQMQVKVIVHESKVDSIQPGMRAGITLQDRDFHGEVTSVATQPEPTSWMNTSVKEYATTVRIDGHTSGLKPGMTAKVEILVADLKNVLSVPVQAVVELGNNAFYCFVKQGDAIQRRHVTVGQSNSTVVEIKQGLEEGEAVVLNPTIPASRDDTFSDEHVDVASKFGNSKTRTAAKGHGKPGMQPREVGPPQQPGQPRAAGEKRMASAQSRPDMAQLDRDGDHRISMDEAPERMREYFPVLDTNHDGSLDAAELAAARSRRRPGPAADGGGQ
ncbi:MAG TPA: HlyD family efflux transporter periplasmic adaptor subunit [Pirellulales bacterium]